MTASLHVDVAILGSGFGGSLAALLLHRIGLKPVLIDRGRHPRFAIGESSTPVADLVLADLTTRYDLPRLRPLAKYGPWKAAYPDLRCGLKRGFSYFRHEPNESFVPQTDHGNELLVAASSTDESSDTHWHRADVDTFFAAEVRREGIPFFEGAAVTLSPHGSGWRLEGTGDDRPLAVKVEFVIDATGEAGAVLRSLGLSRDSGTCLTRSRAVFAHFENVRPWHSMLPAATQADYPFPCDAAALHQLLDEGWMWQLRFDAGIVSAGFAIDESERSLDDSIPVEQEWNELLARYPSIADQFADASLVAPAGGLRRAGRMQRLAPHMAGPNWVLLPNAAGFIDPLHSTGIAQTLCGVERLVAILKNHWQRATLPSRLTEYEHTLRSEFALVDRLVAGGYATRRIFPLFAAFSMLYFAAATTYERRRQRGELSPGAAFLCADDEALQRIVGDAFHRVRELTATGQPTEDAIARFERETVTALRPFNHAGLFDPAAKNMYRHTALPEG
ncbi:MAG: tryptophan 7-halogenase [Planctomycetaceae bacterium]